MICEKCHTPMNKNGHDRDGSQKWRCRTCGASPNSKKSMLSAEKKTEQPSLPRIPKAPPAQNESKPMGLTEEQLRSKHDIRYIVETKCKELKKGAYLPQGEFVQFCGIRPGAGYRDILEHPNHDQYHGKAQGGTVYWGHPDSIKKLKEDGVLT